MRFLDYIFGKPKPRSDPGHATMTMVTDSFSMAEATKSKVPTMDLVLPDRLAEVSEWSPPPRRQTPPVAQAEALVALFQAEGRTGDVPHWELTTNYPECAWVQGFVQLSERQLLHGLSQVCAKVRRNVDVNGATMVRVVCYVIPAPAWMSATDNVATNVVPIGNKKAAKGPMRTKSARAGTAARKYDGLPKSGTSRKGGRYSADIGAAAALG